MIARWGMTGALALASIGSVNATPLNYAALGTDTSARTLMTRWAQREGHPVVWRAPSALPLDPSDVNQKVHLEQSQSLGEAVERLQVYFCRDVPNPTHVMAALFQKGPLLVEVSGDCPPQTPTTSTLP
jgi:hypothetical protein